MRVLKRDTVSKQTDKHHFGAKLTNPSVLCKMFHLGAVWQKGGGVSSQSHWESLQRRMSPSRVFNKIKHILSSKQNFG